MEADKDVVEAAPLAHWAGHCHLQTADKVWGAAVFQEPDGTARLVACWGARGSSLQGKSESFNTTDAALESFSKKVKEKQTQREMYVEVDWEEHGIKSTLLQLRTGAAQGKQGGATPREQILKRISARLPRMAAQIEPLLRPAIALQSKVVSRESAIAVGASKIAGSPDLPPGTTWPQWNSAPLDFIAQINLAEAATHDTESMLPHQGKLYFFFAAEEIGPEDPESWRVIYYDGDASKLKRTAAPEGSAGTDFEPCKVKLLPIISLPDDPADYSKDISASAGNGTSSDEDPDAWMELKEEIDEKQRKGSYTKHQLLGYPNVIQNPMEDECQEGFEKTYGKQGGSAEDWQLLLQVDSDDEAGMMWVDSGMLYFWIRQQDLQARIFDRVWLTMQFF